MAAVEACASAGGGVGLSPPVPSSLMPKTTGGGRFMVGFGAPRLGATPEMVGSALMAAESAAAAGAVDKPGPMLCMG
jgi:hypothetical protein